MCGYWKPGREVGKKETIKIFNSGGQKTLFMQNLTISDIQGGLK